MFEIFEVQIKKLNSHNSSANKLASLEATLVRNYDWPTDRLTRVKSRATSVAKNGGTLHTWDEKVILVKKNVPWLHDFWVCLGGGKDPLNFKNWDIGGFWENFIFPFFHLFSLSPAKSGCFCVFWARFCRQKWSSTFFGVLHFLPFLGIFGHFLKTARFGGAEWK